MFEPLGLSCCFLLVQTNPYLQDFDTVNTRLGWSSLFGHLISGKVCMYVCMYVYFELLSETFITRTRFKNNEVVNEK